MIEIVTSIFALGCASIILARALCVLDHMTPRTRWLLQVVYALQAAGAVAIAMHVFVGEQVSAGGLILLLGVTGSALFDRRAYPPRLVRLVGRGRRKSDAENQGLRHDA